MRATERPIKLNRRGTRRMASACNSRRPPFILSRLQNLSFAVDIVSMILSSRRIETSLLWWPPLLFWRKRGSWNKKREICTESDQPHVFSRSSPRTEFVMLHLSSRGINCSVPITSSCGQYMEMVLEESHWLTHPQHQSDLKFIPCTIEWHQTWAHPNFLFSLDNLLAIMTRIQVIYC